MRHYFQEGVLIGLLIALCWEFGKRVTKEKEPISTVRHAIDAYIEIANEELYEHDSFAIDNLRRALSLALSVKDAERIKAAKLAMIQLESRIAKDELMGLWGFALEELSKVGALDQQERETLLAGLEARLIRVSDETVPNYLATPQLAEHAATLLANQYRKDGRTEDVQRVIRVVGSFYRRASRETSAMVAGAWLMHMRELYRNYGLSAEAAELDAEIAEYGKKSRDEMKVISANVEISAEEIEKYVSKLTEGSVTECFERFAGHFVIPRKQIEEALDTARESAPLTAIIPRSILDHSGRTVATVGGVDDDREGRVVHQLAETMGFQSIFLEMVLEALKAKEFLSAELLFTHLKLSPVFIPERDFLLKRGLRAYVTGDYEAAVHFLVPQFEGAVRTLGELLKLRIYKPRPGGGLMLRVLDELLRDEAIERALGADPCLQCRTLLIDQRGFNVRNAVCHGDAFADTFGRPACDWLIHALLYVGMIRERPVEAPADPARDS